MIFQDKKDVPILMVVFNRPEKVRQMIEAFRKVEPKNIFVAIDGPRKDNPTDQQKCREVQDLIDTIDWPCTVSKKISEINLGLSESMEQAIDWFFTHVEAGIILEDDCIPHPDFFEFVRVLLNRYQDNEDIMVIAGSNFQDGKKRGNASYYFSRYAYIWGWATWKRAWKYYDRELKGLPSFIKDDTIFSDPKERKQWIINFTNTYKDPHRDRERLTWATTWFFSVLNKKGINIIPNVNLVQNVGFGNDGTHTRGRGRKHSIKTMELGEIIHPTEIKTDAKADAYLFRRNHLSTPWKKFYNNLNVFLDFVGVKPILLKIIDRKEK